MQNLRGSRGILLFEDARITPEVFVSGNYLLVTGGYLYISRQLLEAAIRRWMQDEETSRVWKTSSFFKDARITLEVLIDSTNT